MSPAKVMVLLTVLVIALFVISLGVSSCRISGPADPAAPWVSVLSNLLADKRPFDLSEVSASHGTLTTNGQWALSNSVSEASLYILCSEDRRSIRNLELTLEQGGPFDIHYAPRQLRAPPRFAAPQAIPITSMNFTAGQPALKLTILEHGGILVVTQHPGAVRPAIFKLD